MSTSEFKFIRNYPFLYCYFLFKDVYQIVLMYIVLFFITLQSTSQLRKKFHKSV